MDTNQMGTIENIFNNKENQVIKQLCEIILLNQITIFPYKTALLVTDYSVPENSGLYFIGNNELFKYCQRTKRVEPLPIRVPDDWKEVVVAGYIGD